MAEERLRHEAVRAFGWVAVAKLFDRLLGVGRIVVLARILAPEDFGSFGIAVLALGALERLSRPGLAIALVQRAGDVTRYLNATWTVLLLRSWTIAGLLYASRGLVAGFFNTPDAIPIIAGVALATAIGGLTSVGLHILQRELKLGRRFVVLASASLADLLVAIPLAFVLRDAMALVYGMIARNVVLVVMSFVVSDVRPRLTADWRPLADLKTFAVQGGFHSGLFFVVEQGDDAFVGRVLGDAALGVYLVCYRVANILTQEVARMLAEVTLPVFGRVQDDAPRLTQGLRETFAATCAIVLPGVLLLSMTAHPFISLFLGDQWIEGVPAFQVLLVFGLLRALSQVMEATLIARSEMTYLTRLLAIQLAVAVAAVIPLGLWAGLVGVATGIAISQLASLLLSMSRVAGLLQRRWIDLMSAATGPFLGGALAAAVTWPLTRFVFPGMLPSDAGLFMGALVVFTPLYLWVAVPRLRIDAPVVMGVTFERALDVFRRGSR